jgi:ABC-type sugar transport system ATPase subunit
MTGVEQPDSGVVLINHQKEIIIPRSMRKAWASVTVYQEVNLCPIVTELEYSNWREPHNSVL